MMRKGFGWLLLNNLISLSPNIPHYYVNIFCKTREIPISGKRAKIVISIIKL